jgi:hypothetical protein
VCVCVCVCVCVFRWRPTIVKGKKVVTLCGNINSYSQFLAALKKILSILLKLSIIRHWGPPCCQLCLLSMFPIKILSPCLSAYFHFCCSNRFWKSSFHFHGVVIAVWHVYIYIYIYIYIHTYIHTYTHVHTHTHTYIYLASEVGGYVNTRWVLLPARKA